MIRPLTSARASAVAGGVAVEPGVAVVVAGGLRGVGGKVGVADGGKVSVMVGAAVRVDVEDAVGDTGGAEGSVAVAGGGAVWVRVAVGVEV